MRSTSSLRRFPNVAFETVPMFVVLKMALSRPFKEGHLALPLSTPLLQAIDGVMSLVLFPQIVSQHFRSSEKQAACEGCFALQSVCLGVVSLQSAMSRTVHPQEFWKEDVDH